MGYACPVCGDPQADARHLANHLAFTALIRGGDHEAWLEEHAPDWRDAGEAALAERVAARAEAVEFPRVFEDTTGDAEGDHAHGQDRQAERSGALFEEGGPAEGAAPPERPAPATDEATRRAVERAREMTRRKRRAGDDEDESGAE